MFEKRKQLEHRCGRRFAVQLPVVVYSRTNPPVLAQVRNMGREGVFINADARLFPPFTMLRIDLRGPHGAGQEAVIPGIVIHGGDRGVGVMFKEELPDIIFNDAIGPEPVRSPIPVAA